MGQLMKRCRSVAAAIAVVAVVGAGFAAPALADARPPKKTGGQVASAIVAKPGSRGNTVTAIQNNLVWLGMFNWRTRDGVYGTSTTAAVKRFQTTYRLPVTGNVSAKDLFVMRTKADAKRKASKIDSRCLTGARTLCVNRTTKKMHVVVNGVITRTYDVRTGRAGYETRLGAYKIYSKQTNSWSYLYNVWMPYAMYFDGGEAVHYSAEFDNYGYGLGSHGCVNMNSKPDAAALFSQMKIGDKVVVHL